MGDRKPYIVQVHAHKGIRAVIGVRVLSGGGKAETGAAFETIPV
jgi:hypothetical protein